MIFRFSKIRKKTHLSSEELALVQNRKRYTSDKSSPNRSRLAGRPKRPGNSRACRRLVHPDTKVETRPTHGQNLRPRKDPPLAGPNSRPKNFLPIDIHQTQLNRSTSGLDLFGFIKRRFPQWVFV